MCCSDPQPVYDISHPVIVTIDAVGEAPKTLSVEAPSDFTVAFVRAYCSDPAKLDAFRVGWKRAGRAAEPYFKPVKGMAETYPRASTVIPPADHDAPKRFPSPFAGMQLKAGQGYELVIDLADPVAVALPLTVELVFFVVPDEPDAPAGGCDD